MSARSRVVHAGEAAALGPPPQGMLSVPVFAHGTLDVRYYAPGPSDRQTPHERDEARGIP